MQIPGWLMPAFLSFAPLFIVIAPSRGQAMAGALMLSLGLITLFLKTMRLEREIERLSSRRPDIGD